MDLYRLATEVQDTVREVAYQIDRLELVGRAPTQEQLRRWYADLNAAAEDAESLADDIGAAAEMEGESP